MKSILLINPSKYQKFYVNPFYLQIIYARIHSEFKETVDLQLFDVNSCPNIKGLEEKEYDVLVVDTPEGSYESIMNSIPNFSGKHVVLIGDTLKYGLSLRLLNDVYAINKDVYGCLDDEAIGKLVYALCNQEDYRIISGGIFRDENGWTINPIMKRKEVNRVQKITFSDEIIKAYEDRGIQIFMDGITRGCENNCAFCKLGNNALIEHYVRPSTNDVISSIIDFQGKCKKKMFIQFTDENFFGGGKNRLVAIENLAEALRDCEFTGYIGVDSRLDTVIRPKEDKNVAEFRSHVWEKIAASGLRYCFLGLETFNENQSLRYNKQLDLSLFDDAIQNLERMNVYYTIGLILWDPLMSIDELKENLEFIKNHRLIGKTASLLKTLRIQTYSHYWRKYKSELIVREVESQDLFHVPKSSYEYKDPSIRRLLPYVEKIYRLFNDNGYRHSDVALFEVILENTTMQLLRDIPVRVAQLEYDVLDYLLKLENTELENESLVMSAVNEICIPCVNSIYSALKDQTCEKEKENEVRGIYNYFYTVFARIIEQYSE